MEFFQSGQLVNNSFSKDKHCVVFLGKLFSRRGSPGFSNQIPGIFQAEWSNGKKNGTQKKHRTQDMKLD